MSKDAITAPDEGFARFQASQQGIEYLRVDRNRNPASHKSDRTLRPSKLRLPRAQSGKIDPTSLRDPCTDRCNSQREAEKEVGCARESFCDGIEKNQSQRNWRKNQSQSIDCSRRNEKATRTDCK